jgi:hypothetical protein
MLYAQPVWLPAGPQHTGGAYSTQFQHVFTAMHNQAALAQLSTATAGIYAERRFMLGAAGLYAVALALPVSSGAFGLALQRFGFDAFNLQKLGFAYGRSLGDKVSIGLQADYLSVAMQQYGRAATFTFEAGCLLHITQQLHAGFHVFNPPARQLDKAGQDIPVIYTAGAGYEVSNTFLLSVEVIRESARPFNTRIMAAYKATARFSLQLELSTDPALSGAGVGFSWQNLYCLLSGNYHPQLGVTPAATIIWQPERKELLP